MAQEQTELESGQLLNHHRADQCHSQWCALHNPKPGPWSAWPRWWVGALERLDRICPHGVGHPVVESADWLRAHGKAHLLVHDCDGCPCSDTIDGTVVSVVVHGDTEVITDALTKAIQASRAARGAIAA